jgi:putative ABC transport system permease protein
MLRLLRHVSLPQLRASWGRTALVVGGIATGVALIVAINIINTSVLANFENTIELLAGPAALEVTLGVGEVGFPETLVERVRADPGVRAAVPLVRGTVALADDPADALPLFGADFIAEADLQRYHLRLTTSRREALRAMEDPRSVLLPASFAEAHAFAVGDRIAFAVPNGITTLTLRGLLETAGVAAALGGRLAVMDLPAAQILLGKEGRIDQIDVVLEPGADVAAVRRRLKAALPDFLQVASPAQRGAQYAGVLSSFQAMLTGLSTLCLVAGLFIVYNTTSTAAIQRAMAMGQLRLMGAERGRVFRLLMLEALLLGAVGALLGLAIGIPLAWLLSGTITDSMGVIFQMRFPIPTLAVDRAEQAMIAALGLVVALFASYFAARRLAALHPLDAIREASFTPVERGTSRRLVLWWAVLVGLSVAAFVVEDRLKSIAWGNFASTLWNTAVIVIAVPIVQGLSGVLSRALSRWFGAAGRVAAASVFRAAGRAGVTVAAVALILTIAILLSSLVLSCRESLRSYFAGFLACDLVVSAVSTEGGWLETPLPACLATELGEIAGVQEVDTGRIIVGQSYRGRRIGLLALSERAFDPERAPAGWYREGSAAAAAPSLAAGESATISVSLSDRFGLHVGDRIALDSPTGVVTLPIVGVVPDYVSDRGSVIFSRKILAERWGETSVSRFNLYLEPGAEVETVRHSIKQRLGQRYRLKILPFGELLEYHTTMIDRAFAVMRSVELLIVIVTVAGIFDLLMARILERRRELALWRVIGADERAVRRSVVIESATIGALGAVLGLAVGAVTAWLWIRVHFRHLLGYYVEYHFAFGATLRYVALVVAMTMLAGYAAARRATRQSVLLGIQTE